MQLYLLSSDPQALQVCREAAGDAHIVVRDTSDASAIPTSSSHDEATVVITDSGHFLAHADDMARLSAGGLMRGVVVCVDAAAAAAVASSPAADGWEVIATPIVSGMRLRLSDWAAIETLRRESAAHVRQAHDAATAAERASQEATALRQKMAFLDGQRERLSAVMETQGLLSKLSQEINCLDLDEIITVCVTRVPLLVNARYASFYMHNVEAGALELKRHNHGYRIDDVVRVTQESRSAMCRALLTRRIILVRDFEEYERLNEVSVERPNARRYGSKSAIIAPMLAGDRVVAVLNLADKRSGTAFDEASDLPPIEQMSVLVGQAIRNWQLFQEVRIRAKSDAMTGFINHQAFFDELEKETLRVRRYHGALSVLMMDVDHFKRINDRHGHQIGDAILAHVANTVRLNVRDTDIPARYGGDEFAVILSQADVTRAKLVAERIRETVETQTFLHEGKKVDLSLSIGVSQYRAGMSVLEFVNEADQALYQAKANGRNRVESLSPP